MKLYFILYCNFVHYFASLMGLMPRQRLLCALTGDAMIRPKKSCFNVSHFDRNRWTACLSVHRAGLCDYIYISFYPFVFMW